MSSDKKNCSQIMDRQLLSKFRFTVRMVKDGILEAFEDVRLSDDAYDIYHVIRMITGKDTIGVNSLFCSSMMGENKGKIWSNGLVRLLG